jgi:HK97 family phage portal protein
MNVQPSTSVLKAAGGNLDDLVEVTDTELLTLLHDVNEWTDGYAFREALYSDLQIFGRAFVHLVGEPETTELWRMLPQKTNVVRDTVEFVRGFEYGDDPDMVEFPPDEVLWFKMYDPEDPWGGVGPVEAWLKTIDATFAIQDFQNELMNRFGSPDYVVTTASPLDEPQKRAFRRQWREMFGRLFRRRENVAFLEGEGKLERLGQTQRELEFGASEDRKRDQVANAFGVPKSIVDISSIKANSREAKQQHIEHTVWPMVQRVEDVLNAQLVPVFNDRMFIMHENPIPDDEGIAIQQRSSKLQSGYSVNEVRIAEGEEPLDDPIADEPMVGGGFKPLSMAGLDALPEFADDLNTQVDEPEPAALPEGDVALPETVLNGAQIVAATGIIQSVIDGVLPMESARGQLVVMFNLSEEQANVMLAGVEGFEPVKPDPPALPPPQQPQAEDDDEGKRAPDAVREVALMLMAQSFAPQVKSNGHAAPQPLTIHLPHQEWRPQIMVQPHIKMPEQPSVAAEITVVPAEVRQLPAPEVRIDAPIINVQPALEVKAPDVHVDAAIVNVQPPDVRVDAPVINVQPAQTKMPDVYVDGAVVHVHPEVQVPDVRVEVQAPDVVVEPAIVKMEAPVVNVAPPDVHVAAPVVNPPDVHVAPPDVKVITNVEAPNVTVQAPNVDIKQEVPQPIITVESPTVNVTPQIEVNASLELPPRRVEFKRDERGFIREAEVEDA